MVLLWFFHRMKRSRVKENRHFYVTVGRQIAKARDGKMTQESLARKVSLTRTSIINIEKGRQQIQLHTLVEIARELDVPPAELIPANDNLESQLSTTSPKGRAWIIRSAKLPDAGG